MAVSNEAVSTTPNPALEAVGITPSNDPINNFTKVARGLYIGGGGTAVVIMPNDDVVTFVGLLAGTILPVRCKRVNATSTTATNIIALF